MTLTRNDFEAMAAHIEQVFEPRFLGIQHDFDGIRSDIKGIDAKVDSMNQRLAGQIDSLEQGLTGKIDSILQTTDKILSNSRRDGDVLTVIRARQNRMRDVLVQKGVATDQELSITG